MLLGRAAAAKHDVNAALKESRADSKLHFTILRSFAALQPFYNDLIGESHRPSSALGCIPFYL
jgi:hypothetical protein